MYRLKQIIGDRNSDPPLSPIVPVSPSTWWRGVRVGRFPKPQKLSAKVTTYSRLGSSRSRACTPF
ncbi:MAG: hypothetical protein CND57_05040 [SAR92 bacterium MED-G29]|nr:MAG: hypothetical protein CND57_05040 [SAR92 bacterium MED-G29]